LENETRLQPYPKQSAKSKKEQHSRVEIISKKNLQRFMKHNSAYLTTICKIQFYQDASAPSVPPPGDRPRATQLLERARDMWAELKRETDVARTQQLLDSLR
jgi:hypothetical protein